MQEPRVVSEWLMVADAVAELARLVQAAGDILSLSELAWHALQRRGQRAREEDLLVAPVEKAAPEPEGQRRDHIIGPEAPSLSAQPLFGDIDLLDRVRVEVDAWVSVPRVMPVVVGEYPMHAIAKGDFEGAKIVPQRTREGRVPAVATEHQLWWVISAQAVGL